ncbi:hypothetical protein WJX82_003584 [Trebouxia sp. C0006]
MAETGSLAFAAVVSFAFLLVWGSGVCTQTQLPQASDIEDSAPTQMPTSDTPASRHQGYMMGLQSVESFVPVSLLPENTSMLTHSKIYRAWGPGMVPFTDSLLQACRKLAIKLEASMRFEGRVFLSEIGSPEHEYSHLIQLFDVPIQERCKRVCLLSLIPPHQEDLADCPACTQLTADRAYNDFSGLLIVIEVHITRQSYLIGDMSNKQSHNQAWWRWTIDNFREHGFEIKGGPLLQKQLVHNATIASIVPRWQTFEASQFDLQISGPNVLPFNPEKQNLVMHVLHDLHQGLGWGDQYFRFGRIQENVHKKAARIQIINNRVSVAAGLHEGLTKSLKIFEEKMAAEGLRVKVQVFSERNINHESMKDQAELMLYGNWRRHMWLTISAGITTLLIGLATVLKYKGQQLLYWWQGSKVSSFDGLSQSSSKGLLSHSSLESFARSNSSSNPASMRHLKGASNWRAYGIVYKAIRNGVQEVAIKILAAADDQQLHAFKKEIAVLRSLSYDRNLVQFYGACLEREHAMLVLEYMEGGDLYQAIQENSYPLDTRLLSWYQKGGTIALDIAKGLVYLHQNNVVHMDVKSKNILLDKEYKVAKIADVGLARVLGNTVSTRGLPLGTFHYAAPELLVGDRNLVTEKVDIYSFGVVLWEIVTQDRGRRGQLRQTKVPEECPAQIETLIDQCVSPSPHSRPTAREVHDIIEGALQKRTNSLPLDSVLHDAASTNLDPEPEGQPAASGRLRLRRDYRS